MFSKPQTNQFSLLPDQPGVLEPARGVELRVLDGIVWVTIEGEMQDRFLKAGDSLSAAGSGRVVFEALRGSARVELTVVATWHQSCAAVLTRIPARLWYLIGANLAAMRGDTTSAASPALPRR